MERSEIEHCDRILRAYFEGRNWDRNNEYSLKRKLILNSSQLLPNYSYVIEDEWEVEPGRTDKGRGDLVFTDGNGQFAVVEVKWIDVEGLGRAGTTKRGSNRKKRRTVEKQSIDYANDYFKLLSRQLVIVKQMEAYIFTNEYNCPHLQAEIDIPLTHYIKPAE